MSKKPERVGDLNFGVARQPAVQLTQDSTRGAGRPGFAKDGAMEKGVTFQPAKPANVTAPKNLPIPPTPPNNTDGNNKK